MTKPLKVQVFCGKTVSGMIQRIDIQFPEIRCFEDGVEAVEAEADDPGC